jgi:protein associated with RNAse G/E
MFKVANILKMRSDMKSGKVWIIATPAITVLKARQSYMVVNLIKKNKKNLITCGINPPYIVFEVIF